MNLDLVVYRLRYYFINVLNGLKLFDKIKPLIESKDSIIYFCTKFINCRQNMYLNILLNNLKSNSLCYIPSFVIKMGCFPLIKATLIQNLTLSPF